jgi:hypothetical protein
VGPRIPLPLRPSFAVVDVADGELMAAGVPVGQGEGQVPAGLGILAGSRSSSAPGFPAGIMLPGSSPTAARYSSSCGAYQAALALARVVEISRKLKALLGARLSQATATAVARLPVAIRRALEERNPLTEGERNFMAHETAEAPLMDQGMSWDKAYDIAVRTHSLFKNYDPEVINQGVVVGADEASAYFKGTKVLRQPVLSKLTM